MTLEDIVSDYIRTRRPYTDEEMTDFANELSPRLPYAELRSVKLKTGNAMPISGGPGSGPSAATGC
jgi:hypothetical protein